jgi:hypothetical protein
MLNFDKSKKLYYILRVFKNTNNNKKQTNRNIVILFKNIINVLIFLSYLIMSDEEIK